MNESSSPLGFVAPEPSDLALLFPGYEILDLIATGGMGAVYRAVQKSLDRTVALKILPMEFSKDAAFCAGFEAEAKAMARLNHPNLISVFDFGEVNGMLFIVMEFVPGKSIYHSANGQSIDPMEVIRLITGVCAGLAHAHENGILHRDIKPSNILLTPQVEPKIGDFGLARPIEVKTAAGEMVFGTPGYTAPEVVDSPDAVNHRADVFSIGVLLHELLTGRLPDDDPRPASVISRCDTRFDSIIRMATNPIPAERYASAADIAEDLKKIKTAPVTGSMAKAAGRPGVGTPRPHAPRRATSARPKRKSMNLTWVGPVIALAVMGYALHTFINRKPRVILVVEPASKSAAGGGHGNDLDVGKSADDDRDLLPPESDSTMQQGGVTGTGVKLGTDNTVAMPQDQPGKVDFKGDWDSPGSRWRISIKDDGVAICSLFKDRAMREIVRQVDSSWEAGETPDQFVVYWEKNPRYFNKCKMNESRDSFDLINQRGNKDFYTNRFFDATDLKSLRERVGKMARVQGRVLKAGVNNAGTMRYLNFTEPYKNSLGVMMRVSDARDQFTQQKLGEYEGKFIQFSGRVAENGGALQIQVRSLSEIIMVEPVLAGGPDVKSSESAGVNPVASSAPPSKLSTPGTGVTPVDSDSKNANTASGQLSDDSKQEKFYKVIPQTMRNRCSVAVRSRRLSEKGGTPACEDAVAKSLRWLRSQQNRDGSWGESGNRVAMTGLVLLAYSGHCETPYSSEFGDSCLRGIVYLVDVGLKNNGKLASSYVANSWCYEHAIATAALAEASAFYAGLKQSLPDLDNVIQKAGQFIIDNQNKNGGWAYLYATDAGHVDVSVVGWQMQALKACSQTRIRFKGLDSCVSKGLNYLDACQHDSGGFGYTGKNPADGSSGYHTLTGAGMYCFQTWGKGTRSGVGKGAKYLVNNSQFEYNSQFCDLYGHYYETHAMFAYGGNEWKSYNARIRDQLLLNQDADGSWKRPGGKSKPRAVGAKWQDDKLYRTCLCTLMLEVYYRFQI